MSSISSIDTSFYPGLVECFAPKTLLPVSAVEPEEQSSAYAYKGSTTSNSDESEVDLSNYYNEVHPEDLLVKTGQNLVESAQVLDNTMVVAMQNGYSVQDVCNIRLAEMAYKANAYVFNVAAKTSTFAIKV